MIKALLLSLILGLGLSCKQEEIASYDDLTAGEQGEIDRLGQEQCVRKVEPNYNQFKTSSNGIFTSSSYGRGKGFKLVFKTSSTTEKTIEIKIWKQTPTEIFFYVTDDSVATDYFLRWTKAENEQMIDDLKAAHCERPTIYTSNVTSSTLTMKSEYPLPKAPDREDYIDNYTLSFSQPAFFANYHLSRTKKLIDLPDETVTSTTTYTSDFTTATYDFEGYNDPTSAQYAQIYCEIKRSGAGFRFAKERNVEGFKIDVTDNDPVTGSCKPAKPAAWNMSI